MAGTSIAAAMLAALSLEVRPFLRRVQARRLPGMDLPAWEFYVHGKKGVAAVSGLGEAAAEGAACWLMERFTPPRLVSVGFGGAVTPELPPEALVLGQSFWRYDPTTGEMQEIAAPPQAAPPGQLVAKLRTTGLTAFAGAIVTTPMIIHKADQGSPLLHLPRPVVDMETAALAQAARRSGIPFLALRAISDAADEEIPEFICQAARQGQTPTAGAALGWLAADPRRAAILLRLWRRSRLAAVRLAGALEVVWELL